MSYAKCKNYSGCIVAFRGEVFNTSAEAPTCPECGKPAQIVASPIKKIITNIVLGLLVLGLVGGGAWYIMKQKKPAEDNSGAIRKRLTIRGGDYGASGKTGEASTGTQEEGTTRVVVEPVVDTKDPAVVATRTEVVQRIDEIPDLKAADRDKLIQKMTAAKEMGKLIIMRFKKGKESLANDEMAGLKNALADPGVKEIRDEPTAIFVVLGFADAGNRSVEVAKKRAESVVNIMKTQSSVNNLIHYVGLGKSKIAGPEGIDQNSVVEVWYVLP